MKISLSVYFLSIQKSKFTHLHKNLGKSGGSIRHIHIIASK